MSKRLIYTERPLAAPGREDVMKRVFFFFSLCREEPSARARGAVWFGDSGGGCGQLDSCSTRPPTPTTPSLCNCPSVKTCHLSSHMWERDVRGIQFLHRVKWIGSVFGGISKLVGDNPKDLLVVCAQMSVGMINSPSVCGSFFMLFCLKKKRFRWQSRLTVRLWGSAKSCGISVGVWPCDRLETCPGCTPPLPSSCQDRFWQTRDPEKDSTGQEDGWMWMFAYMINLHDYLKKKIGIYCNPIQWQSITKYDIL